MAERDRKGRFLPNNSVGYTGAAARWYGEVGSTLDAIRNTANADAVSALTARLLKLLNETDDLEQLRLGWCALLDRLVGRPKESVAIDLIADTRSQVMGLTLTPAQVEALREARTILTPDEAILALPPASEPVADTPPTP